MSVTMRISIEYERPADGPGSGPVTVGWLRDIQKGGVLYDPPERLVSRDVSRTHAKSAARCPAVIQMESRYFQVSCPFDLRLGFTRDAEGKPALVNRAGTGSAIRGSKIAGLVSLVNEVEWRYPDRPTIQLNLPYIFLADEPVHITQLAPFLHYRPDPLPGTIFGGRFPISLWPRPLMWAFEWHDPSRDIVLRRGEPLFYVQFEADNPARPIQLVEADMTPEVRAYIDHISGAVNYVSQTFSLLKAAEAARPARLVVPKRGG
jgi:hypothetical protein